MVPFGWSAGDVKDAIQFSIRLITAFQDTGRVNSDFQEAVDFLYGLRIAFEHLRTYTKENPGHLYSKDIEGLVQQIDRPWNKFRDFLKPYEDSLGIKSVRSSIVRAPRIVLWTLVAKEVRQLKTSIGQPLQSITLLLLLQLLNRMDTLPQQQSQQLIFALHVAPIPFELEKRLDELKQAIQDNRNAQESHFQSLNGQIPLLQPVPVKRRLLLSMVVVVAVVALLIVIGYCY
ncbi:hypothetical protein AOQ84DRAFT_421851 [Glonium stellatum]|uniref:Uncharacterized protein n=1 Tax=Glonium stellatum TaxID=574774 RepID=A0A8E2FDF4_9PEZI|nr:hypothetical protein AOQ84DRAFT_421851 [Glonium stellatum]